MGEPAPRDRAEGPRFARRDLLLGLLLSPLALLNHVFSAPWWLLAGAMLLVGLALAVHRRYPLTALLVTFTLAVWSPSVVVATGVIALHIGWRGPRARLLTTAAVSVCAAALLVRMVGSVTVDSAALVVLLSTLPWVIGDHLRKRELLRRSEREGIAARARHRERERIAQDMHDSLGHEIGLIAVRAGALEIAPHPTPEDTRHAATDLRHGAARAAEQLRLIIGLLGAGEDAHPPPVSVATLVERARASGMAVRLEVEGEDGGVPDMVQRSIHRVAQEALTNAGKHAPGSEVTVRVQHTRVDTRVNVANNAPVDVHTTAAGTGAGLLGLRERVRLAGGTFSAGPSGGGFEVEARLPHTASNEPPGEPDVPHAGVPLPPEAMERERRRSRWDLARTVTVVTSVCVTVAVVASYYAW